MAFKWTASGKVQAFIFSIILRKDRLANRQSQTCTQALEKPLEIVALLLLRAARFFSKRIISKWMEYDITRFVFHILSSTNCPDGNFPRSSSRTTKWLSTKLLRQWVLILSSRRLLSLNLPQRRKLYLLK